MTFENIIRYKDRWFSKTTKKPLSVSQHSEMIQRAQRSLADFCCYVTPSTQQQWYHKLICEEIQTAITDSDDPLKGLIIQAPPRHGKSEIISRHLPGYFLGRYPDREVIAASYNAELAQDMCMDAQAIMEKPLYLEVFPWAHLPDKKMARQGGQRKRSQDMFQLGHPKHCGKYHGVGAGTAATGRGAHLFIIDDPFKDWEEARSPTIREKRWKWYTMTAATRTAKNAVIIIVCTRWHNDDIVARALKYHKIPWKVLKFEGISGMYLETGEWKMHPKSMLPSYDIREPGEALWPEWFSLDRLKVQRDLDPPGFQAQYQQVPPILGGGMFAHGNWRTWDRSPQNMISVRFWDLGSSKKGDFTVGLRLAYSGGEFYVLDVARFQSSPKTIQDKILEVAKKDGVLTKIGWEEEKGASGKWVSDALRAKLAGFACEALPVMGDKIVRAEPFSIAQQSNLVKLKKGATWLREFFEEYDNFPGSTYDDQVDAGSGAYFLLNKSMGLNTTMQTATVNLLGEQL
jgi:predicted phage terminase large subunit-like protein